MWKHLWCVALPSAALAWLVGVLVAVGPARGQDPQEGRKVFHDSVVPLPASDDPNPVTPTGLRVNAATAEDKEQKLDVLFSLSIPAEAQAKLEARVAKGEVISDEELRDQYSPKAADVDRLVKWLKEQKFEVRKIANDRSGIYVRATAAQIEKALHVNMVQVMREGVAYTAARNAPSLPKDVADGVHGILGLQPYRQARKQSRWFTTPDGNRIASAPDAAASPHSGEGSAEASAAPQGPATNIANAPPYVISEILKAYGANGLGLTGAGQKIAILIDTVPKDADVKKFWQFNGLAGAPKVEKINVLGGVLPPPEGEETLDVEWAGGIAPGATVRVYATGSLKFVDLDRALDQILADSASQPGMRQLSISLGLGETYMSAAEVFAEHAKFVKLAAKGINVFVSSGDAGSNPDATGHNPTGPKQVEFESSDPFVVGVGGTTLRLASGGSVGAEIGWTGSGGGVSILFARPAYQTGANLPAGTMRLVPDVSLTADPNDGAFLVFNNANVQIGGTSWSAPVWAGFCALINEARIKAAKPALPYLNPLLYPLRDTVCFRDITVGSNGAYKAGPHYDMVTGVGVPNVGELVKALKK
jgi:kumamolisin